MAINSHFIPQFLLKGFAFRRKGNRFYVHVFRKGCAPFSPNTENIAAQGNFYGDENIEPILSEAETQFSDLVLLLREGRLDHCDKLLIDRFVAHSLVRTQTFRDSIQDIVANVLGEGLREFFNPEYTPQLLNTLANDGMNSPEVIELLERVSPEKKPWLVAQMREKLLHPDMHGMLRQMILPALDELDFASPARSAQRRVLEDERNLDNRTRDLEKIGWDIQMYQPHSLVLGDIGPLIQGEDSVGWGRIFHGLPQKVLFPLSHSCLLRGQVNGIVEHVDSEKVNLISVENSINFFVASQRTQREEEYQNRLGSRADQLTEENLSDLKQAVMDYLKSPGESLTNEA